MTNQIDLDKRLEEILATSHFSDEPWQHRKQDAKQRITSLIIELLEGLIGEDEEPKLAVPDKGGACSVCMYDDYCKHTIRDELRAEQRQAINQLKGKE